MAVEEEMEKVTVDGSWDCVDPPFSSLPSTVAFNGYLYSKKKKTKTHTNRAAGLSFSSRFLLLLLFSLLAGEGLQLWLEEKRVKGICD